MEIKTVFKQSNIMRLKPWIWGVSLLVFFVSCTTTAPTIIEETHDPQLITLLSPEDAAVHYLEYRYTNRLGSDPRLMPFVRVSEVDVNYNTQHIDIRFNPRFADFPIRQETITHADSLIRSALKPEYRNFTITFYSMGYSLQELIPNYFQSHDGVDYLRRPIGAEAPYKPLIENLDSPWHTANGLYGRNIALWHSHGWYYNIREQRWEWQRPRLFNTTEDMLPMAFTIPYIIPMLEAAGAHVWVPRERDTQHNMVIVDNDTPQIEGSYNETSRQGHPNWQTGATGGFSPAVLPLTGNENPFRAGTWRYTQTDSLTNATATWTPDIPETGTYAVYISYASGPDFTTDARYTVHHTGGSTRFSVNQQLGGGTWIYLGHFQFREGQHPETGSVELTSKSNDEGKRLSADAVRFGGGTGIVSRNGRTSERPRFLEGARYHMQFSGAPDSLVWKLNENNDYSDDFQGRGEWVNYLRGTPFGPNLDRSAGLGIPIELSLSFHTDAGVTRNDTVIGTLSIYTIEDVDGETNFPDGMSRLANRDLTDLMQTQIVDDIRALYDSTWVRRALRNARYSESMRPNVPSTLLELLSHQNLRDMEYAMDPHFRFDVSRAIYKSMLRFVADQHGLDYVVQPLPVTHMMSELTDGGVRLRWKAQHDKLEPSATPTAYVLYTRIDDQGFDNGRAVADTSIILRDLIPGKIYSYKVRAANDGGLSMPSEIIAVSLVDHESAPVLVVNGFTRIAAPAVIKEPNLRGFAHFIDAGVPDRYDIGFSGEQYNFDIYDDWVSDDRPGHGASHGDYETRIIAGNTHDFAYVYARAFQQLGISVVTASEAAVEAGLVQPSVYPMVSVILGKQRQTPSINPFAQENHGLRYGIYSAGMRTFLQGVATSGGKLFISGAHVGTDLIHRPEPDSVVVDFASNVLGYRHITNYASRSGSVFGAPMTPYQADGASKVSSVNDGQSATTGSIRPVYADIFLPDGLQFNTVYHPHMYRVDAPDAIGPSGPGSITLMRYTETEFSAAVGYKGVHRVVTFGFPFESITGEDQRVRVLQAVVEFLKQ